jgi:hypothetical protein
MLRGQTLDAGTTVTLDHDGSLVYVEGISPLGLTVVMLPDQPSGPEDPRRRTVTPFASGTPVDPRTLSEVNRTYLVRMLSDLPSFSRLPSRP